MKQLTLNQSISPIDEQSARRGVFSLDSKTVDYLSTRPQLHQGVGFFSLHLNSWLFWANATYTDYIYVSPS
jgi:hypothetical protein